MPATYWVLLLAAVALVVFLLARLSQWLERQWFQRWLERPFDAEEMRRSFEREERGREVYRSGAPDSRGASSPIEIRR